MRGVDLSIYRFDYDLTLAVLFMHPNGHIYHEYGNRISTAAESGLSMASLEHVMRATVGEHVIATTAKIARGMLSEPEWKGESVEELPTMARRVKAGKGPDCFHCHMVHQARDEQARESGTFDPAVAWRYPPSSRIGLTLDRDVPTLVTAVAEDSPAARAGLLPGDRLGRFGTRVAASEGDVQRALDGVPAAGGTLTVFWTRFGKAAAGRLELSDEWRVGAPEDLWRSTMWRLDPRPGFGGPMLSADEKNKLGIDAAVSAFRIQYIVTWGDHSRTGRNAKKAGLRKNDVVLSAGGKDDFAAPVHFHAWFRLTRKVGETVPLVVLRKGGRVTIELPVIK